MDEREQLMRDEQRKYSSAFSGMYQSVPVLYLYYSL